MAERQSGGSRGRGGEREGQHRSSKGERQHRAGSGGQAENSRRYSLEEREYVGRDGKIHHHTNVYMAQHEGESRSREGGREGRSGKSGGSSRGRARSENR